MKFDKNAKIEILMLGCGGTGAYTAPHIYRIMYASKRKMSFCISDGDTVEQKNLDRQNFAAQDIGRNKAEVIAERYAGAYGFNACYVPDFIENTNKLYHFMNTSDSNTLPILISCVDNNKSRKIFDEFFAKVRNLVYIDAGNSAKSGQVVCGIKRNRRTYFKPVSYFYPDMFDMQDKFASELSCAEAAVSAPQSVIANLTASTIIVNMLSNIIFQNELTVNAVHFFTDHIHSQPTFKESKRGKKKI